MSIETQRVSLMAEVKSFWSPAYGTLAYPNVPFTTPQNSQWAEVFILAHGAERASLSNIFLKRTEGSLQFNLYCPQDKGSKENSVIADAIEDHFQELLMSTSDGDTIEFGIPNSFLVSGVDERREGTNSNWFRYVVDCPFVRSTTVRKI
jgi:hypothetical protein